MSPKARPSTGKKARIPKFCAFTDCENLIPEGAGPNTKWCSESCRNKAKRRDQKRRVNRVVTEAAVISKETVDAVLGDEAKQDIVRKVFTEQTRDLATIVVKDEISKTVAGLVMLLPQVVENLAEGLQSKNFMVRRHAEALVLKYTMDFMAELVETKAETGVQVIVNSPAAQVTTHELIEHGEVEAFEADWPTCEDCGTRNHPDNMHNGVRCKPCQSLQNLEKNMQTRKDVGELFAKTDKALYGDV